MAFQGRFRDEIGGPALGIEENLPHTSILQHPYRPDVSYDEYLDLADSVMEASWGEAYYQPNGWLFAHVDTPSALVDLHYRLFEETKGLIDVDQIDQSRDLTGLNETEQRNYRSYGYRYLGSEYRPHVTLGVTRGGASLISADLVQAFHEQFAGKSFLYDRIVFYEAGECGVLKRIVAQRAL